MKRFVIYPKYFVFFLVLIIAACSEDDKMETATKDDVLSLAADFLGGEAALNNLNNITYKEDGIRNAYYEEQHIGELEEASDFTSIVTLDLANNRERVDYDRNTMFINGTGFRFIYGEIYNTNIGFIDGLDNIFQAPPRPMTSARTLAGRKELLMSNATMLIKTMMNEVDDVSLQNELVVIDGVSHHELIYQNPLFTDLHVFIDRDNGQISEVRTLEADNLCGMIEVKAVYSNWTSSGGIQFAAKSEIMAPEFISRSATRSDFQVNTDISSTNMVVSGSPPFDAGVGEWGNLHSMFILTFRAFGLSQDEPFSMVTPIEIAPNVIHLMGNAHHSLAIIQDNGIVIVEPPLHSIFTASVINWAETNYPDKPITHCIVTHHHQDHIGGVREFMALDIPIVANELISDFLDKLFNADHSLQPDGLSNSSVSLNKLLVPHEGQIEIESNLNPIEVISIPVGHSEDMVIVYLPEMNLVFTGDMYNPFEVVPTAPMPPIFREWAEQFNAALINIGLTDPDMRIVGVHGIPGGTTYENMLLHLTF